MQDTITVVGIVGTPPRHIVTATGLPVTSFRLASKQRRFDRAESRFVDGETNWYSVSAWRQLAVNAVASLEKGDRVIVTGRLKVQSWENGGRTGLNVEIDAESIGHDLCWGTTRYAKTGGTRAAPENDAVQDDESADPGSAFADAAEPAGAPDFLPEAAAVVTPF